MSYLTTLAFKQALEARLEAIGALAGVKIYTAEETAPDTSREHIILGDVSAGQDHHAMGGIFLVTVDVTCRIYIHKPTQDEATSRAEAIFNEVLNELATPTQWTVSGNVIDADVVTWTVEEGIAADNGRTTEIEFHVEYRDTND